MGIVREIQAKTLLATVNCPDAWFGVRYNMNIYRGCEHRCIYCDSRSECYQIENFDGELLAKTNALELLERELAKKRIKACIGTGSMSDPYTPAEEKLDLTGRALKIIARFGYPVHITTKSDLILKDLDTLREINKTRASVSITLTTIDDNLARIIEPEAPSPSARIKALKVLSAAGITVGVTMMPVLPYILDTEENVRSIVDAAAESGASYIFAGFGVTLRNRQREYFYKKLDRLFPGIREKYQRAYGDSYSCNSAFGKNLHRYLNELCATYNIKTEMKDIVPSKEEPQLELF